MVPKKIQITLDEEQLAALDAMMKPGLSNNDWTMHFMKAMPLWMALDLAYKDAVELPEGSQYYSVGAKLTPEEENKVLKNIIDRLEWRIRGLVVRDMLNQQMAPLQGEKWAGVIADLALIPETVTIHCTEDNSGYPFTLTIRDIVAIRAMRRVKRIYIRNNVAGGDFVKFVEANISFDDLLPQLQKNALLLQAVNRSTIINIMEYKQMPSDTFALNDELTKQVGNNPAFKAILKVKKDSKFNKDKYEKCRWEIDHYINSIRNMETVDGKLKMLARYKNSLPVS